VRRKKSEDGGPEDLDKEEDWGLNHFGFGRGRRTQGRKAIVIQGSRRG